MSLANQLNDNKDTIQKSLYIGRANWDGLVEKVSKAEQEQNANFKDEQILTFLVCAAYAAVESLGVANLSEVLSGGNVSTEKIWFEVLPYPTRELEGNTNLDLAIGNITLRSDTKSGIQLKEENYTAICFCECKWLSDISLGVSRDTHRNQMARVIENALLFSDARGRLASNVYFTLVTPSMFRSRSQFSRLYQYKWKDYQTEEMLIADLDSCNLEPRSGLSAPSTRASVLNLKWVTYEELIFAAPTSALQAEVHNFFRKLSLVEFTDSLVF